MGNKKRIGATLHSISALGLLAGVAGCGAPDGSLPADVGEIGEAREAIADTPLDRPPAAAGIGMMINGTRHLRVFACGDPSRNVLQFSTLDPTWQTPPVLWSAWTDVSDTDDAHCAGTPAVGGWPGSPNDALEVFYRGLNDELRLLYVDPDGNRFLYNLSQYLGIGPINGDPVMVDIGTDGSIAVVVRLAGDKLTSIDWYSSDWHTRPVLNAAGKQVITSSTVVGHFDAASYGFFSTQVNSTQHLVFTRRAWDKSFTQLKGPISSPSGLLTFAHIANQSKCDAPYPCVVTRGFAGNIPQIAATTGTTWSFTTVHMAGNKYTPWGDGAQTCYGDAGAIDSLNLQTPDRGLFWFWADSTVSDDARGYGQDPGESLMSGPNLVVNPGTEYGGWSVINSNGNVSVLHFNRSNYDEGWIQGLGLPLSTL